MSGANSQILLRAKTLLAHSNKMLSLLPVSGTFKYLLYLLVLINIRSFPLAWHFRVFWALTKLRSEYYALRIRTIFWSKADRIKAQDAWFASRSSIGAVPFDEVVKYKMWAGPDDCDFYGHLSNSSYAKTLDSVRFKAALHYIPYFFRAGAWIALGATHFQYIKEIPRFVHYEVHICTVAWDEKWIFAVARFVSRSKPKSKKRVTEAANGQNGTSTMTASIHTPANADSTSESPSENEDAKNAPNANTIEDITKTLLQQASSLDDDDLTLHCVSVSQLCLKIGRITVPPAVAFAMNGFSRPPPHDQEPYSVKNLPPHWNDIKGFCSSTKESIRANRAFLKGGWREVPEGKRWWEEALGGEIEERRAQNLKLVVKLREGLEGAREIKV